MEATTITLGESTYELPHPSIKHTRAWRGLMERPIEDLLTLIEAAPTTEITDLASLSQVGRQIAMTVLHSPDLITDLVFEFAPALKAQRDVIEETATPTQMMDAFVTIARVVFPLDRLMQLRGPVNSATSPNSRSVSGALALKR